MKNNKINHLENKNDKQQPLTETFCQRLKNIIDKNKIVYGLEKKKNGLNLAEKIQPSKHSFERYIDSLIN